jgi:hypothetical protein
MTSMRSPQPAHRTCADATEASSDTTPNSAVAEAVSPDQGANAATGLAPVYQRFVASYQRAPEAWTSAYSDFGSYGE